MQLSIKKIGKYYNAKIKIGCFCSSFSVSFGISLGRWQDKIPKLKIPKPKIPKPKIPKPKIPEAKILKVPKNPSNEVFWVLLTLRRF